MGLFDTAARANARKGGTAWGKAFRETMQSPAWRLSKRVIVASCVIAGGYSLLLSLAVLSPEAVGFRQIWLAATTPVTDAVAALVPGVRRLAADLALRGFMARAPLVGHLLAFQWLILAAHFLFAAAIVVPERGRLARAFAAAREARARTSVTVSPWRKWVVAGAVLLFLLWWPFNGASHDSGRYAYDLAATDNGVFFPFLLLTWAWWIVVYCGWLRLLVLWAAYDELPSTPRS